MPKSDFSDQLRPYVGQPVTYAKFQGETLIIGFGEEPSDDSIGSVEPAPASEIRVNKVSEGDIVLS